MDTSSLSYKSAVMQEYPLLQQVRRFGNTIIRIRKKSSEPHWARVGGSPLPHLDLQQPNESGEENEA